MTSILGRYATYSGKVVTWDAAINTKIALSPDLLKYSFDSKPPIVPGADGFYPIAMPGKSRIVG